MKLDLQNSPLSTEGSIRRIAAGLRTALRLTGLSHRACERELGLSTGYLTRILDGQVQLRVGLVLDLCRMLDLPPAAFFAALFPAPQISDSTARLLRGIGAVLTQPHPSSKGLEEALLQLRGVVRGLETYLAESATPRDTCSLSGAVQEEPRPRDLMGFGPGES